jgi:HD superfamily phosphohydrolase YqeK
VTGRVAAPTGALVLPSWAVVSSPRRAHIARVTALLDDWAAALDLPVAEAQAWHDAGRWHDALRDAPPEALRGDGTWATLPTGAWHGPAAAARLAAEGEARTALLEAVRWHTVGEADWAPVGRALYCADYLEPGRPDADGWRAAQAARFPADPEAVFRAVVARRIRNAEARGLRVHARTLAMAEALDR